MVQRRDRSRSPNTDLPSHLKCEISRRNPRGSTWRRLRSSALGSRATDVLTGKKSGDPTVPALSILAERRVRCIPPVCGGPGTVRGRRIPCCTEVELFGAHARQGKETVHLVGNRRELVGRQGRRPPALVMAVDLAVVVDHDSPK